MNTIYALPGQSNTPAALPDVLQDGTRKPADFDQAPYANDYRGKTHELPRPTAQTHTWCAPQHLAQLQHGWDVARYWDRWKAQASDELTARNAHDTAEKERQQAERDDQRRAAQRTELLAAPKRAFLNAGGTEEMWTKQEDGIYQDILREQALRAAAVPQQAPVNQARYRF